jgi:hypothetical protein
MTRWEEFEEEWCKIHENDEHDTLSFLHWSGDEPWVIFDFARYQIQRHLDLSTGKAQRTLRELCASGDVRAIQYDLYDPDTDNEHIKPSEWLKEEVDLRGQTVGVSCWDVEHWLYSQNPIEEPAKAEGRTSKKRELVQQAIKALWPDGIPEIPNTAIERQVGKWITDYCKQHNLSKLDISSDTILRAAGRK